MEVMHGVSAIFDHCWVFVYSILYQLVRDWVRRFIEQNYFLLNATNFEIVGLILSKSWHFNKYVRGRNKMDLFIIFI